MNDRGSWWDEVPISAHFSFPPQNSRDNMSVILVAFPNAPMVSEAAIAKVCDRLL